MKRKPNYFNFREYYKFFIVTGTQDTPLVDDEGEVTTKYFLAKNERDLLNTIKDYYCGSDYMSVDEVNNNEYLHITEKVYKDIRDYYFFWENERLRNNIVGMMNSVYFDIPNKEMNYAVDNTKAYFDENGWFLLDCDGKKQYENEKWLVFDI